uniref:Uncharacterized protein n=1 Tax=Caenorhabditis japonica TaxID=281687 RepID=A0A8R1IJY1_CAEJA
MTEFQIRQVFAISIRAFCYQNWVTCLPLSLFPSPVLSLSLDVIRGGRKLRESDMGKKGKLRNNNKAKKKKKKKK